MTQTPILTRLTTLIADNEGRLPQRDGVGLKIAYVTNDGGLLCGDCSSDELGQCLNRDITYTGGWRIEGITSEGDMEDPANENCDQCGDPFTTLDPDDDDE